MHKLRNTLIIIFTVFFMFSVNNTVSAKKVHIDNNPKKVYLTFDDGPTYVITNKILNILKENDVKATFFIVGKEIDGKEEILKRIYTDGHGIGVHTYTHDNKHIYRSEDMFLKENILTAEKIEEVTGFYPKILRFPGGSSNKLTYSLLEKLHENNFKVFDWNVNIEDGKNPYLNERTLYVNSLKIKGDKNNAIILMHCNFNNKNTVKVLPIIIEKYKSEGYSFEPINYATEEYYYKIRKK